MFRCQVKMTNSVLFVATVTQCLGFFFSKILCKLLSDWSLHFKAGIVSQCDLILRDAERETKRNRFLIFVSQNSSRFSRYFKKFHMIFRRFLVNFRKDILAILGAIWRSNFPDVLP